MLVVTVELASNTVVVLALELVVDQVSSGVLDPASLRVARGILHISHGGIIYEYDYP
jgi:hypothetical protein